MTGLIIRGFFPLVRFVKEPVNLKGYGVNLLISIATFAIFILPVYIFPLTTQEDGSQINNVANAIFAIAALSSVWFGLIAFGTYMPAKKDKRYKTGRKGNDTGNKQGGLVLFSVTSHLLILALLVFALMEFRISGEWKTIAFSGDDAFGWYWLLIQNLINGYMYAIYPYLYNPDFKYR